MRVQWAAGAGGKGVLEEAGDRMFPPPPKPHTDGGNLLLLKGYLWAKTEKSISHISVALSTQPGSYLPGNLLKIRSKRDEFMEGKPELFLHGTGRNIVYFYLKTLIQEACVLPKSH